MVFLGALNQRFNFYVSEENKEFYEQHLLPFVYLGSMSLENFKLKLLSAIVANLRFPRREPCVIPFDLS